MPTWPHQATRTDLTRTAEFSKAYPTNRENRSPRDTLKILASPISSYADRIAPSASTTAAPGQGEIQDRLRRNVYGRRVVTRVTQSRIRLRPPTLSLFCEYRDCHRRLSGKEAFSPKDSPRSVHVHNC